MRIRSIQHKALSRLIERDDGRRIKPELVSRIRNILAALVAANEMGEVSGPPGWRIHQLSGDRAATWSISASGNWRITFHIEDNEIVDLDLEDYH
jgi:proteic killer suppression protein